MTNQGFDADRPVSPMDREAIANIEVGHTHVSPRVAGAMVVWFLLMLAVLPLFEVTRGGGDAWSHLPGLKPGPSRGEEQGLWNTVVTANRGVLEGLSGFEAALEDQSAVGRALRPRTQLALSRWLGAGNERVYVGREGWLFYRPDVEYVTGRGFLEQRVMDRRVAAASEYENPPQPDPRPAILQFKRDLDARGITLVLMPTPVKPTMHPGDLARRYTADVAAHNPSYHAFVNEMRQQDVLVFDPFIDLARTRSAGTPLYLTTDTHWRPETMQRVAESLAAFLQQHAALPSMPSRGYTAAAREARQIGDTAAMLDLPPDQTLYSPERVTLRFVMDAAGDPWQSSRDADILVLGDSFTNMYSLATMGWGEAAGLVEQLSYTLQRPIDRIVQNDQAAHATRELLLREIEGGSGRLTGKRVVIWQFAARELSSGDWKVVTIPSSP
jgi:hypothetical protein